MSSSMPSGQRPLAIVTGASSGIGYELVKCCARDGFDLLIAADEPAIQNVAENFRGLGAAVDAVQADLSTTAGVDTKVGTSEKDAAATVAETGFKAMMKGEGDMVTGWKSKLQTAIASVTPAGIPAKMHRAQAEPGSAKR